MFKTTNVRPELKKSSFRRIRLRLGSDKATSADVLRYIRRNRGWRLGFNRAWPWILSYRTADLSWAILVSLRLRRQDLRNVNFFRANLSGGDLYGSNLSGVDLRKANLEGADMTIAILEGALLEEAILEGTALPRANLSTERMTGEKRAMAPARR